MRFWELIKGNQGNGIREKDKVIVVRKIMKRIVLFYTKYNIGQL